MERRQCDRRTTLTVQALDLQTGMDRRCLHSAHCPWICLDMYGQRIDATRGRHRGEESRLNGLSVVTWATKAEQRKSLSFPRFSSSAWHRQSTPPVSLLIEEKNRAGKAEQGREVGREEERERKLKKSSCFLCLLLVTCTTRQTCFLSPSREPE